MSRFAAGSMTSRCKRGCLLVLTVNNSRCLGSADTKVVGVDFWKQRLALTAKMMYHCQYSRDTRPRRGGGDGQGKEEDSSQILEDNFAWTWYGIQSAEMFEIQHDGRSEAAENSADRVCEALLRKKNVIGDGRRECMFEWKDRLLVIREDYLKESAIKITPKMRIITAKFRLARATSTVLETIYFENDTHDPRDEDVDDRDDEDDIESVLGLPRYRYRHDRAIKIRESTEDDDDLPSIDSPGEKPSEIGEWIVLDLLEDSRHLSVCEASTFVSSLLPLLDSSCMPIPLTPPPTSISAHPSSLHPSLPHNYGALAFPEWPRKAGMGSNGGVIRCLMWGLAHTREEEEEVEEDGSGRLPLWRSEREKEPTNDKDYEDDEEDDADYDQEQSDRTALEPSGVALDVNVLVDGHGLELQHSRSDEPQLHEQGLACRPSMPSLLFGGSNVGSSGGVLGKRTERKKDRARTIHGRGREEEERVMEKSVRGLDPALDFVDPRNTLHCTRCVLGMFCVLIGVVKLTEERTRL
ncbi:hypothetical protein EDD85DRAFT_792919 [Armillaria nabsnona]|nr:hypothetical protein EDD85DRAFT_792919 [Armillaria nabsnona]